MNSNNGISLTMYCCMYAECGNEYITKFNLKRHVESVHMKIKRFKCSTCGGLYSSKQSLKEHNYIHLGFVPFECKTCKVVFRQASQLSLHKRVHNAYGIKDNYVKAAEDHDKFTPITVGYETKTNEIELPAIDEERTGPYWLPFPKFPNLKKY